MQAEKVVAIHDMQTPMQAAFAPWHVIEKWLKEAVRHKLPISINGLWTLEEVQKMCRSQQQVRDIISTYINKGMAVRHDLPPEMRTGDKRDRVGYMWNTEYKGEPYRPSARVVAAKTKKPGPVSKNKVSAGMSQIIRSDKAVLTESPKAVELMFQGMMLTVSRNPENGNMRLQIDALE